MKLILLIQHCQSEHHVRGMAEGWTDTSLTDLGRKQAESIGIRLAAESFGKGYKLSEGTLKDTHPTI